LGTDCVNLLAPILVAAAAAAASSSSQDPCNFNILTAYGLDYAQLLFKGGTQSTRDHIIERHMHGTRDNPGTSQYFANYFWQVQNFNALTALFGNQTVYRGDVVITHTIGGYASYIGSDANGQHTSTNKLVLLPDLQNCSYIVPDRSRRHWSSRLTIRVALWTAISIAAMLCLIFGLPYLLGMRLDLWSLTKREHHLRHNARIPAGVVTVITPGAKTSVTPVRIWNYNAIYAALGVSGEAFLAWQRKYGLDSLGVGTAGELFIPDYPVFSKVAWTHIDSVDLSPPEIEALIGECDRAISNVQDLAARKELEAIRSLSTEALKQSATVRFGHP
jgi:hypothetical protein